MLHEQRASNVHKSSGLEQVLMSELRDQLREVGDLPRDLLAGV